MTTATASHRLLLVFDGGLAPGYAAVAVAMTEEAEARGYEAWAAREGFRSLAGANLQRERIERLSMDPLGASRQAPADVPVHNLYGRIDEAGSSFRSERYPGLEAEAAQREASRFIIEHGFGLVVFAGGNGTLQGAKRLCQQLPSSVRIGFINCSIDSDLRGDSSIGFLTALEEGGRVARGLFEDALTHKRHYILEMMGNHGGKHALHCGAAARAHLIILPQMDPSDKTIDQIAAALDRRDHSLTIVAEGYCSNRRPAGLSAAAHFRDQLAEHGFSDQPERRVIVESYSRFIRGLRPLLMENERVFLKCQLLLNAFERGASHVMPYYLGEHELGVRALDEVQTDNAVQPAYIDMLDRLGLRSLREHARTHCV